jgi:hypothetical protein
MFLYLPLRHVLELIIKVKFSVNKYGAYNEKNLKMEKKKISQNFTSRMTASFDASPDPDLDWHHNGKSYPDRHQHDADPQRWLLVLIKSCRIPTGNRLVLASSRF